MLKDEADLAIAGMQMRGLLAGKQHLPAIGTLHSRNDAQQRRLAATRRTEEGNEFPSRNVQVDVFKRHETAKAFADRAYFNAHESDLTNLWHAQRADSPTADGTSRGR